jgi:hypothetical protein
MPYTVRKTAGGYAVTHAGHTFGRHPSKAAAQRQIRAIYANENKPKRRRRKGK